MNTAPLKAAVIGAGLMGNWHAQAIERAGASLSAFVDINNAMAKNLACNYPGSEIFSDAEEMFSRLNLDVVHICAPLSKHVELVEMALENDVHVMVEKPMTSTLPETEHLLNLANKKNLLLCPVHQFLFQDGSAWALENIREVGKMVHTEITVFSAGGEGRDAKELDDIVDDILPHPLSLLQAFYSPPMDGKWDIQRPAEGEFRAMTIVDGSTLSINISMSARPTECSMIIVGDKGTFHIDLFHGYAYKVGGRVSKADKIFNPLKTSAKRFATATFNLGKRAVINEPAYPGLRSLVKQFYSAIRSKIVSPISVDDVIKVAYLRDKIIKESRGKK